jgi:hypothetical protein
MFHLFLHGDLYRASPFQVTVITNLFSLWLHKSLLCTFQPIYNDLYWFLMPVEAEISVTKDFIMVNIKNSKSRGKQEVDVR